MAVYFLEQRLPPLTASQACWQPWGPHWGEDDSSAEEELMCSPTSRRSRSYSGYTSHRHSRCCEESKGLLRELRLQSRRTPVSECTSGAEAQVSIDGSGAPPDAVPETVEYNSAPNFFEVSIDGSVLETVKYNSEPDSSLEVSIDGSVRETVEYNSEPNSILEAPSDGSDAATEMVKNDSMPNSFLEDSSSAGSVLPFSTGLAASDGQEQACEGSYSVTTFVVLNLPRDLSLQAFIDELEASGFTDHYDFCHVPRNMRTARNLGFAFVNFTSQEAADGFKEAWQGTSHHFPRKNGRVQVRIKPAKMQGLEACAKIIHSKKMQKVRSTKFRPVLKTQQ